jgi:hypothetical protein
LLFKGLYEAPQKIAVAKKALDPQQKNDILRRANDNLSQAIQQRLNSGIREL